MKKYSYIQVCGTYTNEILVCVNYTNEEVPSVMRRHKVKDDAIESYKNAEGVSFSDRQVNGGVWHSEGRFVIFLPRFTDTWLFWETLLHETNHVTFLIAKDKGFLEEVENIAYLHEYLFRSIRTRLYTNLTNSPKKKQRKF